MYQLMKKRDGQQAQRINNLDYPTKQEAVNELHNYCSFIAEDKNAIYHYPDDLSSNVRLTSDGMMSYDDILDHPSEENDSIRIDVYVYYVEEQN